jgi:CheY-like chemotaxis protein
VPDSLLGDPTRLRQILLNLLSNAIKFTEQGMVLVSATLEQEQGEQALRLCVKDTGIGLTEQAEAGCSSPSPRQTAPPRANMAAPGWGWPSANGWPKPWAAYWRGKHAGRRLGVLDHPAAAGHRRHCLQQPPPSQHLVLLAGDSSNNQQLWSHYLDSWALPHHCAGSLAHLLETLRQLDAADSSPDVLLLVEPLPDATLEQAVQTLGGRHPMVVCLHEQDGNRKTSLLQQGIAVLHKPMKQSALLDALTVQWTPGNIRLHTPKPTP